MKSVLSILLFVGLALGYSTSYYGWVPQKEFIYHFESQSLSGIPEIRSQYSGVKLSSTVRIQSYPDYSLRIKFENPKFLTINEELPVIDGKPVVPSKPHEEVPEVIRHSLVTPFDVHIKRGIVESLFVEKDEPIVVTNLKKALLAQIQMDLSASREFSVQKLNHVVLPQLQQGQEEMHNISFFKTMETSLHGDCETSYTFHPLPLFQAREIEEQWRVEKIKLIKGLPTYTGKVTEEKILKESHQAESICHGQQYYQITKTKNLDNCRERPVYSSMSGVQGKCDFSKNYCEDLLTHSSTTKYVVCGSPEQFYIRKALSEDLISSNTLWNTKEHVKVTSIISLELLKVETTGYQPLKKPTHPKKLVNLFFEYPEKKTFSHKSISEYLQTEEGRQEQQFKSLTGFYPVHPMPELNSAPELLFPTSIPMPELVHQVKEIMTKVVKETYETPESCSSSSDVAGYIMSIAKALRPLSVEQLKEVQAEVMRHMETRTPEIKKTSKYLLLDIMSMVGTNPSVVFIKELIESEEIPREYAAQLLQSTLKNIKTPTPELMNMVFSLVKNVKAKSIQLYAVSCVTFSDLLYRSCVNPTSMVSEFPVRLYGNFCNPETSFIKEQWITYLESELESSVKKPTQEKVIIIHALGKLGHYKALIPLVKVIEGKITSKPLVRSMAVYNLKRIAIEYPSKVRPVLLALIDNPAENTEVRIAAVSILPFSTPTPSELQKIALRTWFEPSKQVTSFIYSTLKSLSKTDVPELVSLKSTVQHILTMVKPVQTGIQFSHNVQSGSFIDYLKVIISNGLTLVNSEDSLIPKKVTITTNVINRSYKVKGLELSLYTQGMDFVLEKFLYLTTLRGESSQNVRAELQKLEEKLQIKKREGVIPEAHLTLRFFGLERMFSFNSEFYFETIQKISEELRSNPKVFTEGLKYQHTKSESLMDVQIVAPTDSGFPVVFESNLPIVYSVKTIIKANNTHSVETESTIPSSVKVEVIPVMNAKLQFTAGVISPFTKQYIGAGIALSVHSGLPLETLVTMNKEGQVSLKLKSPEQIIKEVELLHVNIKPFTFKKSLSVIEPTSQSSGNKLITSGHLIKKVEFNPGQIVGLDTPLKISTDYNLDLATVYQLYMKSPSLLTTLEALSMPFSARYTSVQVRFNPISSPTKELQTRFTLAKATKKSPSDSVSVQFPSHLSHHDEINKLCIENHESEYEVTECLEHQQRLLKSTSDVSSKSRKYCEEEKFASRSEEELQKCLKSAKVCEQAELVCLKKSFSPKVCVDKKIACQVRQRNLLKTEYLLRKLQSGNALSLSIEGAVNSHYEQSTSRMFLSVGCNERNMNVKTLMEVDLYTPSQEPFIIETEINTKLPEIKTKWNKEQLLSDDLKTTSKLVMLYGLKSQSEKKKVELEVVVSKTESQKQSVRRSVEYQRCSQEEAEGKLLSPICEKVRHQAASVDKLVLKAKVPSSLSGSTTFKTLRNLIRTTFLFHVKERSYDSTSVTGLEKNEFVLEALVSRQGEEASIKMKHHSFEMEIEDIRMPYVVKNVLPLSLRNGVFYRLVQKTTQQQSPASCQIENKYVSTFDNKTYPYTINDCEHLLVKDCSGTFPIAVTTRGSSSQKQVKIASGLTIVELKSETGSVLSGVYVNGEKKTLRQGEIYTKRSPLTGKVSLEIQAYLDGVVVVREYQQNIEVSFDGERIEVVAPQVLRSRACGLCGDLNGETTADLLTPKMCVFRKPRIAAYSYMIKDSCQGIPSQDKSEFEREVRECTKKVTLPTPLEEITERSIKIKSGPKGILRKHLVEFRANGNEICFSKVTVPVCEKGSVPVIGELSSTPFTCILTVSPRAKSMKMKVEYHETIVELSKFPTTYTRMIEEASGCRKPSESSHSSSSSSHYQPHHGRYQPQVYDY